MKKCTVCKTLKDLAEYNKKVRAQDGLQNICRDCNKTQSRKYYSANQEKHVKDVTARNKKARATNREYVMKVLLESGCVDCGFANPVALEFDHVRGEKIAGVGFLATRPVSMKKLKEEISKCEVRCRNCHQIRTCSEQNWWNKPL